MKHTTFFLSILFFCAVLPVCGVEPAKRDVPKSSFTISVRMPDISFVHLPWVWNVETKRYVADTKLRESALAIIFRSSKNPAFFDVWVWRACRSGEFGYADDLHGYLMPDGTLKLECDVGLPPWQVTRPPTTFQSTLMSRYAFRQPTESRGDVTVSAYARQETRSIYITFVRKVRTGYPDDLPLDGELEYALCALPGNVPVALENLQFYPMSLERLPDAPEKPEKAKREGAK